MAEKSGGENVWRSRKRTWFGMPWTFTVYTMTEEKLYVDSGIFNKKSDEIRLYRVLDVSLTRKFGQRIFGLGTLTLQTADKTLPVAELKNIKNSRNIRDLISDMVEKERMKKRVISREAFDGITEEDAASADLL